MNTIKLKGITMEDFCNYRSPSMFLATCYCDWKCCKDYGMDLSICQNSPLNNTRIEEYNIDSLVDLYISNPITKAIVFGGLEPLLQTDEIIEFIKSLSRKRCYDEVVIYTGYTEDEVKANHNWSRLRIPNVIIKYGRFIPNDKPRFDEILGVTLASSNQYAVRY